MKTRRGFWFWLFGVTLILSGAAWGGSHWRYVGVDFDWKYAGFTIVHDGAILIVVGRAEHTSFKFVHGTVDENTRGSIEYFKTKDQYQALGFTFNFSPHVVLGSVLYTVLIIPLWFPTVLSGLGFSWRWWRWRKKRHQRGFEVEAPSPIAHP